MEKTFLLRSSLRPGAHPPTADPPIFHVNASARKSFQPGKGEGGRGRGGGGRGGGDKRRGRRRRREGKRGEERGMLPFRRLFYYF